MEQADIARSKNVEPASGELTLVRVVAPHFVAGFETDGTVRRAAPIIKYMVGWPNDKARAYIIGKGWKASIVPTPLS